MAGFFGSLVGVTLNRVITKSPIGISSFLIRLPIWTIVLFSPIYFSRQYVGDNNKQVIIDRYNKRVQQYKLTKDPKILD